MITGIGTPSSQSRIAGIFVLPEKDYAATTQIGDARLCFKEFYRG